MERRPDTEKKDSVLSFLQKRLEAEIDEQFENDSSELTDIVRAILKETTSLSFIQKAQKLREAADTISSNQANL